ncbi:hypothetical protein JG30_13140 [Bombilactobacillus mellifer]|uniref:WxL domain-containing protein n=1 Tax=Bombilactobacillus mellifer TaxID=1218492 RepID=A0A0F4LQQ5_9LACO|nr:hypothetical protein [Bombilactobacillus mellifer]KJY60629.1 hypothetical protein JG30_13140 [Bombilactobacillus mellifer]
MKTFKIPKKHFNIFLVVLLMIGSLSCFQIVQADETPPQTEVKVTFQQATLQFTQLPNFDFGRRNQFSSSEAQQQENQIKVINKNDLIISSDAKVPFNVSVKSMGTYVLGLKGGVWSDLSKNESTSLTSIWKSTQQNSGTLSLAPSSVAVKSTTKATTDSPTDKNLKKPDLSLMYFPSSADNPQGGTSQDIWSTSGEGFPGTATISFPNKDSAQNKDSDKITQIMVNNGSAYSNGNNIEKTFLESRYKEVVLVFPLAWNAAISADDQVAQE